MECREIGTTGMSAGIIGMGAEYLDGRPYEVVESTIHQAMDLGVNIMDVFMPGEEVRRNIGRALKGRRDKMLIQGHIGSTDINEQYDISRNLGECKKYFEYLLEYLDTDYIDFGMLFFIDSEEDYQKVFESDIITYAQKLKKDGVIRAIGASSHNPVTARKVVETGEIELLMFSVNPAFDMLPPMTVDEILMEGGFEKAAGVEPSRAALYHACERRGVAITTMKTLGAGKLLSTDHSPFNAPMSVAQCIQYALDRPAVVSTLIGYASAEEVRDTMGYFDLTSEQREYSSVLSGRKGDFEGSCVYCNHCLPCPSEINIATVNKYLDIALLNEANVPPSIRQHYKSLTAHGSDCVSCGSCEERCPFGVQVMERMEKAADIFGG